MCAHIILNVGQCPAVHKGGISRLYTVEGAAVGVQLQPATDVGGRSGVEALNDFGNPGGRHGLDDEVGLGLE